MALLLVCVSVSPAVLEEFPALFHKLQTDKNKREGIYTYEPPYEVHLLNSLLMQMSNLPVAWQQLNTSILRHADMMKMIS